jgi:hypothetical protein
MPKTGLATTQKFVLSGCPMVGLSQHFTNGTTSYNRRFFPVDLAGDFVLMSDYTGKEVVE